MAPKRKLKSNNDQNPSIFSAGSEVFEGKRYFKDPKKISDHLICGICQDVFDEPWNLTCGHAFCHACIQNWFATSQTCPIDRSAVLPQYCSKNIPIANIIGDLTVACPWRPYGCPNIDKYYIIKDHSSSSCSFNPNKMCPTMQAKMRQIVVDTPPSFTMGNSSGGAGARGAVSSQRTGGGPSALDELMAQLESGDAGLDDSALLDDDTTALPELEVPSLATRLYLNAAHDKRDILVDMLATSVGKPVATKKSPSGAGRPPKKQLIQ